jgi:hypothetical protein
MTDWHTTLRPSNAGLFSVALALAVAPIWFTGYIPMVDLPQHAAQIAALHEIRSGNTVFTEIFTTNWFTPYLLGYTLLYLLSTIFPIQIAAQALVSVAIVSVPLATALLIREVGADPRWRWLAIPGAYSFSFYWGFLSFLVAVPVALMLLRSAIRFDKMPDIRRATALAAFSIALFFCHVIALGFISVVAAAYFLARHPTDFKKAVIRCIPLAAPLPIMAAWAFLTYDSEAVVRNAPVFFGPLSARLKLLLVQPAGFDQQSMVATLVTVAILLVPVIAGSKPSRDLARWAPFGMGLLLFVVWPRSAFHTAFMFPRLGVFIAPLWLVAWDPPSARHSKLDTLAMIVVLVWLMANVGRFAAFAREIESFDRVLDRMEPGQRAAGLVFDRGTRLFGGPVHMHMPAWYQAKKHGIVDFNFADAYAPVVRFKPSRGPRLTERVGWYPWEMDWAKHGGSQYRYFVVKAPIDVSEDLFGRQRDGLSLITREGDWWLYERRSSY